MIKAGTVFIWTGLISAIPSGWERETALDGRFPKGTAQGTEPNVQGGNATHSHTSPAHSHNDDGHTHTITVGNLTTNSGRGGGADVMGDHNHGSHASGAVSGGGLSSVTSTYDSVSNNPPYYEVIYIKPTNNTGALPNYVIALCDKTDFVNNTGLFKGFYKCDGDNSTPNLTDKYLRGAGTGQEAGTTGGSTTNVHDLSHTHSVNAHTHAGAVSNSFSNGFTNDGWGGVQTGIYTAPLTHTHTTSLNSASDVISSATPQITTTETVEPAYTKLMPIQNRSGSLAVALGMIGMWLGALSDIPRGWVLCDGTNGTVDMRGRHLKMTTTPANIGGTGGSNTHTHSNNTHTHTSTGHTHGYTTSAHPAWSRYDAGEYYHSVIGTSPTALHSITVATATTTYSTATTSADSSNNEPLYTTVAYIKLVSMSGGGSLLASVL